jgi:hypothetical protein
MENKLLYQVLYNNLLLPRKREIDREEEQDAFDGTTESLVNLYRKNQITYDEFTKLSEAEIQRIIDKSKDLHISKDRFFQLLDLKIHSQVVNPSGRKSKGI